MATSPETPWATVARGGTRRWCVAVLGDGGSEGRACAIESSESSGSSEFMGAIRKDSPPAPPTSTRAARGFPPFRLSIEPQGGHGGHRSRGARCSGSERLHAPHEAFPPFH